MTSYVICIGLVPLYMHVTTLHKWHLRSIFVAGTFIAIASEIKYAFSCLSVVCALMWNLYVHYSGTAVEHLCAEW